MGMSSLRRPACAAVFEQRDIQERLWMLLVHLSEGGCCWSRAAEASPSCGYHAKLVVITISPLLSDFGTAPYYEKQLVLIALGG